MKTKTKRSPLPPTRGFTLIEVTVVITILTVALGMLSKTLVSMSRLGPVNRETARAIEASRSMLEEIRSMPFDEVFARYNDDDADDPDGPGTAPGNAFDVPALDARPGDLDGFVGEVFFPTQGGELREDMEDALLGLPCDLSGDGTIDALDHATDYAILPVHVRLEWVGNTGPRSHDTFTILVRP